jgi:hypothetical protein
LFKGAAEPSLLDEMQKRLATFEDHIELCRALFSRVGDCQLTHKSVFDSFYQVTQDLHLRKSKNFEGSFVNLKDVEFLQAHEFDTDKKKPFITTFPEEFLPDSACLTNAHGLVTFPLAQTPGGLSAFVSDGNCIRFIQDNLVFTSFSDKTIVAGSAGKIDSTKFVLIGSFICFYWYHTYVKFDGKSSRISVTPTGI